MSRKLPLCWCQVYKREMWTVNSVVISLLRLEKTLCIVLSHYFTQKHQLLFYFALITGYALYRKKIHQCLLWAYYFTSCWIFFSFARDMQLGCTQIGLQCPLLTLWMTMDVKWCHEWGFMCWVFTFVGRKLGMSIFSISPSTGLCEDEDGAENKVSAVNAYTAYFAIENMLASYAF